MASLEELKAQLEKAELREKALKEVSKQLLVKMFVLNKASGSQKIVVKTETGGLTELTSQEQATFIQSLASPLLSGEKLSPQETASLTTEWKKSAEVLSAAEGKKKGAREFLKDWLEEHDYHYVPERTRTETRASPVTVINDGNLLRLLRLDAADAGVNTDRIGDAFEIWKSETLAKHKDSVVAKTNYDPKVNPKIQDQFINMVHAPNEQSAVDAKVVAHTIWQIKRKMRGLPVTDHMMAIFYSKIGGYGKTELVKRLTSPARGLDMPTDFGQLSDDRFRESMTQTYVLLLDEMQKAESANIETLKHIITAEDLSWHIMNTTSVGRGLNIGTALGTSNKSLAELFHDYSGLRRFYEIEMDPRTEEQGWDDINSFDYLALWKSVDENKPSPIKAVLSKVKEVQQESVAIDPVQRFLEGCVALSTSDVEKWISSDDLYTQFDNWDTATKEKSGIKKHTFQVRLRQQLKAAQMKKNKAKQNRYGIYHKDHGSDVPETFTSSSSDFIDENGNARF